MGRSRRVTVAALAAVLVTLAALATSPGAARAAPDPAWVAGSVSRRTDAPDPVLLRDGSTWYSYTTNTYGFVQLINVPVDTSPDLRTWTFRGDALPALPAWAKPGRTWAPSVVRLAGRYVLHFAAWHTESDRQCIGVATSSRPGGPFEPAAEPLVCPVDQGGAIDPSVFVDRSGVPFLAWKTDGNCCRLPIALFSQRLTLDGTALVGDPAPLLAPSEPWELGLIENPEMTYVGSSYWLFYSSGDFGTPGYATGLARCATPLGACRKLTGPWMASDAQQAGPGGLSVLGFGSGATMAAWHAWLPWCVGYDRGCARVLHTGELHTLTGVPLDGGAGRLVGVAARPDGTAWAVRADGRVVGRGASPLGNANLASLGGTAAAMAATPSGDGYWVVSSQGEVQAFGAATFQGDVGGEWPGRPVVAMAATPTGGGYWLVTESGRVLAFGDAPDLGSVGRPDGAPPIVALARTASGAGYWVVGADGAVAALGDAPAVGSWSRLGQAPVVAAVASPNGGLWLVASDGDIGALGGAAPLPPLVVDRAVAATGANGGLLVASRQGAVLAHPRPSAANVPGPLRAPACGPCAERVTRATLIGRDRSNP